MDIFRKEIIKSFKKLGFDEIPIEVPPDPTFGDYSVPCFIFSKKLKKDPAKIAQEFKNQFKSHEYFLKIETKGPYLNFFIDNKKIINQAINEIIKKKDSYGSSNKGKGKKILLEHTSINPNASPHIGRARNALIGDSMSKILKFQGFDVETHFYVNDVGKQIAMLVLAGKDKTPAFKELLNDYIQINKEMETDTELTLKVFQLLRRFEDNDKKVINKFKEIVKVCIDGQARIFSELGITYDKFDYESEYLFNKQVDKVILKLKKTGKLFEDEEKRLVLDQKDCNLYMKTPVLVLTRADKTSLYPLRDIAYTIDKFKKGFDRNIVVLGEDQKLYAQQLRCALKLIDEEYPEVIHYSFVLLDEGKMSTRKGNLVLFEDFMDEALEKAISEIKIRHKEFDELTAKKIAYGAIKFSILRVSAEKNVMFNWKNALNFEGDSGPYIQYSFARICSIFNKYGGKIDLTADVSVLKNQHEISLVKLLRDFPDKVEESSKNLKVNVIPNYLIDLAKSFNEFYNECPILKEKEKLMKARLILCYCVKQALKNGMNLVGMETVDKM